MFESIMLGVSELTVVAGLFVVIVLIPLFFRVVVDTNKVHIVQSKKRTTSYGAGMDKGVMHPIS